MRFVRLVSEAKLPKRAHKTDAGFDLYAIKNVLIHPGKIAFVPCGVVCHVPIGYFGLVLGRSSASKRGLLVFPGVIDVGYEGDCGPIVKNLSDKPIRVRKGQSISQLILLKLGISDMFCFPRKKVRDPKDWRCLI